MFTYTMMEDFVNRLLRSLYIQAPQQLTIENISNMLGFKVYLWEYSSETDFYKGKCIMFLEYKETEQKQWQEFAHELCHYFLHVGRQEFLPKAFVQLQERQANNFSYHFCVPTIMLRQLKGVTVYKVMNLFNVEYEFALRRLEMYRNKFFERRIHYAMQ